MRKAKIIGTGIYAPERVIENEFFNHKYGKDIDSFLRSRRNIHRRHWMNDDQSTSDLIVPACQQAVEAANLKISDIDLIVVATDTPDQLSPSTASVVQYKLGAKNSATFDVNSACAGFVTAYDLAIKYLAADPDSYRNILVVGAYGISKYLDHDDYKLTSMFADGAGAIVLQGCDANEAAGSLASELYSDGQFHDYMGMYAGGTAQPLSHDVLERKTHLLNFAKRIPLETNSTHWPRLTHLLLDRCKKTVDEIDHFFMTQLNIETINHVMDLLNLPHHKSHNIMDRYGYTGSACVPMAICDAAQHSKLKKGDFVLLLGSGGGVSMAASALIWGYDT